MSFYEIRFPTTIQAGTMGGPEWATDIVVTDSGYESRNARWSMPVRKWDVARAVMTREEYEEILTFFMAVGHGRANGFRFRDRSDYRARAEEESNYPVIGTGDGVTTEFQLKKIYQYGGVSLVRDIAKPVDGTVKIYLDGMRQIADWEVDTTTGIVSFVSPPPMGEQIQAEYEFDVPVRFDIDYLPLEWVDFNKMRARIPIVEIKV